MSRHTLGGDVRERLLEAGLLSFHQHGFNGCGVQEIADLAGVPKGSFYNYFESKEVLGAEVLDHYWHERTRGSLRLLSDESLRPAERLHRYFTAQAEKLASLDYKCGCLMGNLAAELSDHSKLISDRLSSIFAGWTRALATCIRDAQRAGEVRTDIDADALAAFLLHAWEGATLRARIEKDGRPLAQFMEVALNHLLA
jgi:TetR/AcrR family transcriptional repressor of nem operon